jgi:exosortase
MPPLSRYRAWGWGIILLIPFIIFFWRRLDVLAFTWMSDGIYSLCPFVPLISLGLIYLNQNRLRELPVKPSALGLVCVGASVAATVWFDSRGTGVLLIAPLLMIITIAGGILALRGWQTLREMAFPVAFLLFLLPIPPKLMLAIDYPLQALCARTTAGMGNLVGLRLQCTGAQLQFPDPNVAVLVAPACNGLRSMVALLAIAAVYAYLLKGAWYRRCLLVVAAVPLAYVGNLVRLLGIVGMASAAGQKFMTYMPLIEPCLGLLAFVVPLALLFLLARTLRCREFQHIG